MGIIYYVACKDCKVTRDLDKFYAAGFKADTKEEMEEVAKFIEEKYSYRAALLATFMDKHEGHHCVFFNEHSEVYEELEPFCNPEYTEEDYWSNK